MGPVDALSRKDEIDMGNDNWEITLLKGDDQYFHICTKVLCGLCNLISSSAHASVVQGYVEFLLVFLEADLVMRSL